MSDVGAFVAANLPSHSEVDTRAAILADRVGLTLATSDIPILDDITMRVAEGERISIIGPSGGGKTTFLNILAGVQPWTSGQVLIRGEPPRAGRADTGYVMARDALLPWRTAVQNVELSLQIRNVPKRERLQRALVALDSVGLRDAADRYRAELSQGMRQRVALARALVAQPTLIFLDEPFAALDAQTRIVMNDLLLDLIDRFSGTAVLITHDLNEAILFADRIFVFTARPARLMATHVVELPRPRHSLTLRRTQSFLDLYETLWSAISGSIH